MLNLYYHKVILLANFYWDIINKSMDIFTTGLIVLFGATAIFYIVFFSFIFYWHLVKVSFVVVPVIFAFEFFVMGFFVVTITSIILNYLPGLIRAAGI